MFQAKVYPKVYLAKACCFSRLLPFLDLDRPSGDYFEGGGEQIKKERCFRGLEESCSSKGRKLSKTVFMWLKRMINLRKERSKVKSNQGLPGDSHAWASRVLFRPSAIFDLAGIGGR